MALQSYLKSVTPENPCNPFLVKGNEHLLIEGLWNGLIPGNLVVRCDGVEDSQENQDKILEAISLAKKVAESLVFWKADVLLIINRGHCNNSFTRFFEINYTRDGQFWGQFDLEKNLYFVPPKLIGYKSDIFKKMGQVANIVKCKPGPEVRKSLHCIADWALDLLR